MNEEEITGINITPLVDVVLVLLIIFMVTANYLNKASIEISLPSAETGTTVDNHDHLVFSIDKQRKIYLNDTLITKKTLASTITNSAPTAKQVTVRADQSTPHGAVIELIDTLRANGINEFALQVSQKELSSINSSK